MKSKKIIIATVSTIVAIAILWFCFGGKSKSANYVIETAQAVGELLRFERQRLAVALRLAVFADALAVEEVAAVNLQPGLVAQHLDGTSRGGFPDRGGLLDAALPCG